MGRGPVGDDFLGVRAWVEQVGAAGEFGGRELGFGVEAEDEVVVVAHEGEGGDLAAVGAGVVLDEGEEFAAAIGLLERAVGG